MAAISGTDVPVRFGARCCASMRNGVGASGVAQTFEAALALLGAASRSCWQPPSFAMCLAIAAHDPRHASAAGAPVSVNAIANAMVRNTSLLERRRGKLDAKQVAISIPDRPVFATVSATAGQTVGISADPPPDFPHPCRRTAISLRPSRATLVLTKRAAFRCQPRAGRPPSRGHRHSNPPNARPRPRPEHASPQVGSPARRRPNHAYPTPGHRRTDTRRSSRA